MPPTLNVCITVPRLFNASQSFWNVPRPWSNLFQVLLCPDPPDPPVVVVIGGMVAHASHAGPGCFFRPRIAAMYDRKTAFIRD
jgi:hypothetical protein